MHGARLAGTVGTGGYRGHVPSSWSAIGGSMFESYKHTDRQVDFYLGVGYAGLDIRD